MRHYAPAFTILAVAFAIGLTACAGSPGDPPPASQCLSGSNCLAGPNPDLASTPLPDLADPLAECRTMMTEHMVMNGWACNGLICDFKLAVYQGICYADCWKPPTHDERPWSCVMAIGLLSNQSFQCDAPGGKPFACSL